MRSSGALKRSKIDKVEPSITYEAFVEDLDGGDSFTASLIDVLVKVRSFICTFMVHAELVTKELAERRTRESPADRRLIADQTAKSLRLLATPLRVYRERPLGGRDHIGRRVNLTDYLSSPPDELAIEDDERDGDDGYDGMVTETYMEDARASELYDAYGAHGWSSRPLGTSLSRRSHPNLPSVFAPPLDTADDSSSQGTSAPPISAWGPPGGATFVTGSASRPSRQSIVRRPIRVRATDFNEFSARRRSTFRDVAGDSEDARAPEDASEPSWFSPPLDGPPGTTSHARRFFPPSRRRRDASAWNDAVTAERAYRPEDVHTILRPWHGPSSVGDHDDSIPQTQDAAPRLRRGGPRAPESLRSPRSSPGVRDTHLPPTSSIVISISREARRDTIPENIAPPPIAVTSEGQD